MNKPVVINARKFDGRLHRSWEAELVSSSGTSLVFLGRFGHEVNHPDLGVIRRGTLSYEFYWTDRWYNVFRFHEPEGALRNYYCNLSMPAEFRDGVLDYVDLELDLLVGPDFTIRVLDEEEYAQNSERYAYGQEVLKNVDASIAELNDLIGKRAFPFDHE